MTPLYKSVTIAQTVLTHSLATLTAANNKQREGVRSPVLREVRQERGEGECRKHRERRGGRWGEEKERRKVETVEQ